MGNKRFLIFAVFYLLFALCTNLSAQVASRTDGVNVFYYDSLFDAVAAVSIEASIDQSDEITLLADIILDEPLIVDDGVHIRLVTGGSDRTIHRSVNNIDNPVIWVRGENASLSLGKPDMEYELIIDGGYLNSTPIVAHSPLIALSGPDAKLIMYDNVTLQNNKNIGYAMTTNYYQNGAGVYIFTQGDIIDRQAEFIMKGGTIRGNINDTHNPYPCGGGVMLRHFGIFTMEGGVIMNNTSTQNGGGFYTDCMGSFKKTGGIIYGSNAPVAFRNTALNGTGTPKGYGHAVSFSPVAETLSGYRDDTVGENDNLSYAGNARGEGAFGKGEKWYTHDKALRRLVFTVIMPIIVLIVCVIVILRIRYLKKLNKIIQEAADTTPYIDYENFGLSDREKDLCELLLTDRPLKDIALILELSYAGVHKNARKLYVKLGIHNRTELLVRIKNEK
jgi:DNA-binding CsgD family transcriptional regulator